MIAFLLRLPTTALGGGRLWGSLFADRHAILETVV